jgi:hypothetical protein
MNTKLLFAGFSGTSVMTLFSYVVSAVQREQFREPQILSQLIQRLVPAQGKKISKAEAWLLHYSIGLLFNLVYDRIWQNTRFKPSNLHGLVLGALSGVVGMTVWKTTLELHPDPPGINFRKFGPHLLVTHLVFSIFSTIAYRNSNKLQLRRAHHS